MPCFVDTNILLYSISPRQKDVAKRDAAVQILDRDDVALSVQVLQEFYVQATRPSGYALSGHLALGFVRTWLRFAVQETTTPILLAGIEFSSRYKFSYWDGAIVAAAQAAGCDVLYTEDLSHGQVVDGVTIVNPFRDVPAG